MTGNVMYPDEESALWDVDGKLANVSHTFSAFIDYFIGTFDNYWIDI